MVFCVSSSLCLTWLISNIWKKTYIFSWSLAVTIFSIFHLPHVFVHFFPLKMRDKPFIWQRENVPSWSILLWLSDSFGDSFLSLHVEHTSGMHYACRLHGAAHRASGLYMANLMWQLIYILWQDTSNRHHWLQAFSSALLFLVSWKESFGPLRVTSLCLLSACCSNKERDTAQIALSINRGEKTLLTSHNYSLIVRRLIIKLWATMWKADWNIALTCGQRPERDGPRMSRRGFDSTAFLDDEIKEEGEKNNLWLFEMVWWEVVDVLWSSAVTERS